MAEPAIDLDALLLQLHEVKRSGEGYKARCPAHEDRTASLSVSIGRSGAILLNCFAGCSVDAICAALNLSARQLFPPKTAQPLPQIVATYDYRDARGDLQYQVCRFVPKDFRQRRPNGGGGWLWNMHGVARIPYRLNELKGHATIYVCEGEKDADALWAIGLPATTNVGGAGKWKDSDSAALHAIGAQRIVIVPDNDAPGQKHAHVVAQSVKSLGLAVLKLALPELAAKGDVSDWIAKGHTRSEFDALVSATLYVMPKGAAHPGDNAPLNVDDPNSPARWELTELGAAEAFVGRFGAKLRYDHQRERWLVWNCHHWKSDATMEVERLGGQHIREWRKEAIDMPDKKTGEEIERFARGFESRGKFANMLRFAVSRADVLSSGTEWDSDAWLLGCPNGVIDLRTGELRDGQQRDHMTLQVGPLFDAAATCPRWEGFVNDIFDHDAETVGYVQRALGYSLTGDTKQQIFFLCVGHGSNGKSTFLNTIEHVLDRYAYTTSMATFTVSLRGSDSDFNLAELDGPRVIIASETKTDARFNEQLLKNFTGGERINAQRKHGHPFVYNPVGKIWIAVNHQPTVKDDSTGFWRRMRIINFPRTFLGSAADLGLIEQLRAEASGILAWAVRGCLAFQRDGLQTPHAVMQAVEEYREGEDPLNEFISECVSLDDPEYEENFRSIYYAYKTYEERQGTKPQFLMARKRVAKVLKTRFSSRESNGSTLYRGLRVKIGWNSPDLQ